MYCNLCHIYVCSYKIHPDHILVWFALNRGFLLSLFTFHYSFVHSDGQNSCWSLLKLTFQCDHGCAGVWQVYLVWKVYRNKCFTNRPEIFMKLLVKENAIIFYKKIYRHALYNMFTFLLCLMKDPFTVWIISWTVGFLWTFAKGDRLFYRPTCTCMSYGAQLFALLVDITLDHVIYSEASISRFKWRRKETFIYVLYTSQDTRNLT